MKKTDQGLATVDIKGKDYVMVNSRVKYFRKNFKDYTLQTVWLKLDEKMAICKAIVKDPAGRIYSTGTAYETAGSSFINKTSFIENCETSAVGRCLGFCDIGIEVSLASAEEVGNAIKGQNGTKTVTFPQQGNKPRKPAESGKDRAQVQGKGFYLSGKEVTRAKYTEVILYNAKKNNIDIGAIIDETQICREPDDMDEKQLKAFGQVISNKLQALKKK